MSKRISLVMLAMCALLLIACGGETPTPEPTQVSLNAPEDVASSFLSAWNEGRYADMYRLLSPAVMSEVPERAFIERYEEVSSEAQFTTVSAALTSLLVEGDSARAAFRVAFQSVLAGPIEQENVIPLVLTDGRWGIDWSSRLILVDLGAQDTIEVSLESSVRGAIYDRQGRALASLGKLITVGVVPAQMTNEATVLATLSQALGMTQQAIKDKYKDAPRPDWFMPVADLAPNVSDATVVALTGLPGVVLREKPRRVYPQGVLAAHVVGYIGEINPDELAAWQANGYQSGDLVGKSGLERWAESYLAGQRGMSLVSVTAGGQIGTTLAKRAAVHSRNIVVTLNLELQKAVEQILGQQVGSIVVMDPRNGDVLAMASYPAFSPEDFALGIQTSVWDKLTSDPSNPLLNRATQPTYRPGSIFKVVTMAAGLEKGGYEPTSQFTCPGYWSYLGRNWPCWVPSGHGAETLVMGLTQSCNVVFFQIGSHLYDVDGQILPDMARAFGLGKATGIELPGEAPGLIPDAAWKRATRNDVWMPYDGINMAIGEGDVLVTPIQMTMLYAAIANGGTLFRPRLVAGVPAWSSEDKDIVFDPEVIGKLPVSAENLAAIKQGLEGVTSPPYGTAADIFAGLSISVAGKTGTPQTDDPAMATDAWFACYAPAESPEVVVTVIVEGKGYGSRFAAPLARKVIEAWMANH